MTIEFFTGSFIKQWPNWTGEIPQKGDIVVLHFGDKNETTEIYAVRKRLIDETRPDKISIELERIDK